MLEFGQDISFLAFVIIVMISDLHLLGETYVATCPGYIAQVPRAPFLLHNSVKYCDVTLEFGQHISFVAFVIIVMISDLHLLGKLMSRPVQATSPKYPEPRFSSIIRSIIVM